MIQEGRIDDLINSPKQDKDILKNTDFIMGEQPVAWAEVAIAFSKKPPCKHLLPDINTIILERLTNNLK